MLIRDNFKTEQFIKNELQEYEKVHLESLERIRNGIIPPERIQIVEGYFTGHFLSLIRIKYSLGYPIEDLVPDYMEALKYFKMSWVEQRLQTTKRGKTKIYKQYKYLDIVYEILSLGILLKVDKEALQWIIDITDEYGIVDHILEYLFCKLDKSRIAKTKETYEDIFYIPMKYERIRSAIECIGSDESMMYLQEFIEDDFLNYDYKMKVLDVKPDPKVDGNYRYWCWLVAAIVAGEKMDDTIDCLENSIYGSLRDVPYYPKDMVDWCLGRID